MDGISKSMRYSSRGGVDSESRDRRDERDRPEAVVVGQN